MKRSIGGVICGRDSGTGQFIPVKTARRRKRTAEVQRIPALRLKNGRFAKP